MQKLHKQSNDTRRYLYDFATGRMLECEIMMYDRDDPHVLRVLQHKKMAREIEKMRQSLLNSNIFGKRNKS